MSWAEEEGGNRGRQGMGTPVLAREGKVSYADREVGRGGGGEGFPVLVWGTPLTLPPPPMWTDQHL